MAKVELKQPIVEEISKAIDGAKAAVIVQYLGLTVEQDTALRKELREAGVNYKVYKNTLMRRAFEGTVFAELDKHLEGANAIAISKDDPIIAEKILAKYVKNYKCFNFQGGIIEGQYADEAKLNEMANIPSREVLLGRLFGSMQSPITNMARVLKQIAEKDAPAAE